MAEKSVKPQEVTRTDGHGFGGTTRLSFEIPAGEKYTRYNLELLTSPLVSGAEVPSRPKKGATGEVKFQVRWWHAPFTSVRFRLRVYYGSSPEPVIIDVGSNDWWGRAMRTSQQKVPFSLRLRGPDARELFRRITMAQGQALPEHLLPEHDFVDEVPHESVQDLYFNDPHDGNGSDTLAAATVASPAFQTAANLAPVPALTAEATLSKGQRLQPAGLETLETFEGPVEKGQSPAPLQELATASVITIAVVFAIVSVAAFALIGSVMLTAIQNGQCPVAKHKSGVGSSSADDTLDIEIRPCN